MPKSQALAYWLSVGALPSENCGVLIKKYGKDGTRLAEQQAALERIKTTRPQAPERHQVAGGQAREDDCTEVDLAPT